MDCALDCLEPCLASSSRRDDGITNRSKTSGGGGNCDDNSWSQSNLSLFRYYAARECVHCPQHSDIGLVTVIPTAVGGAGLHIYDWRDCCWFDVETAAPAGVAVVFCGESLAALTAVADKVLRRPLAVASLRWLSVCPV